MYEKVNPSHPDKIADRIAGAIVDLAYLQYENPHIAVEVLIGHDNCHVIIETDVKLSYDDIIDAIQRITLSQEIKCDIHIVEQDKHLHDNQAGEVRCGDNGIFKGMPITEEQAKLSKVVKELYEEYPTDGKFIIENNNLIACQSQATDMCLQAFFKKYDFNKLIINPLGYWTGGINVDTGATNRKLGSDMADSVTGGGLHGKDLSKADVSVNIYAFIKAQETGKPVELHCAIGDALVDGKPYSEIVDIAKNYIKSMGGFEKFAEWGLI